ncbi:MAG: radical SAM protein [Paenibacillaceae bacterium]|nr:radical SAM protein [Paenibacillaceae bacterium]
MKPLFEEEDVEIEVDVNKKFIFPADLVVKRYEDSNLVIYTEGVLWLVLSDKEKSVFDFLSLGGSIAEALKNFNEDDVVNVISQIEAKQFEYPIVKETDEKNLYIYLTNNCNERCKHCYMYAGDIIIQELNPDVWMKVLTEYKTSGGHGVTFTGGEVSIYKGFKEVLKKAHELGLIVTVLTNGIQWEENEILECSEYINEVQISIDGYDRKSYYAVRQYDGFDKAITTLIRFSENGTRVSMAVTPLYDNLEEFIAHFEPFARDIIERYPQIYIRFNLELLDGRDVQKKHIDNAEYRRDIRALVERLYTDYYMETFPLNYEGHIIRKNCGFGEIAIAANGDVYWCNRILELTSKWNVLTTGIKDIMEHSYEIKTKTDVDHSTACRKCEIRYICGGDCRMNYSGIKQAEDHDGMWENVCPEGNKEAIYKRMVLCNEYFYTDLIEE